jgi:hypothetical protein
MFARRLASSLLALSLLGGLATANPKTYRFEDDLVTIRLDEKGPFATPPGPATTIDRAAVKAALAKQRAINLAAFRAYQDTGLFPHNFVKGGALNVWLDQEGHLCAAATLIANTNPDLAMSVAPINDFIRLADVKDGALMDWMLTSGFTQEEIVAIQEPFMGKMEPDVQPDPRRLAEDARLMKRYAQVTQQLVKARKVSLERAVDRLMANPTLAASLLAASS